MAPCPATATLHVALLLCSLALCQAGGPRSLASHVVASTAALPGAVRRATETAALPGGTWSEWCTLESWNNGILKVLCQQREFRNPAAVPGAAPLIVELDFGFNCKPTSTVSNYLGIGKMLVCDKWSYDLGLPNGGWWDPIWISQPHMIEWARPGILRGMYVDTASNRDVVDARLSELYYDNVCTSGSDVSFYKKRLYCDTLVPEIPAGPFKDSSCLALEWSKSGVIKALCDAYGSDNLATSSTTLNYAGLCSPGTAMVAIAGRLACSTYLPTLDLPGGPWLEKCVPVSYTSHALRDILTANCELGGVWRESVLDVGQKCGGAQTVANTDGQLACVEPRG